MSTQATAQHMLTTVDNPYNPFTHFAEWNRFDQQHGHHTLSLLARVIVTSNDLSEGDQDLDAEVAMQEIIRENVSGLHRLVTEEE
jgi:hypothetical protein